MDRSAAYAARWVAKNVVAAGLADRCELQVAYAIGVARPVSVAVETFGTEHVGRGTIARLIDEHFDLRPGAFREELELHRPLYRRTAAYGHFGRDEPDFTWERTDKAPRWPRPPAFRLRPLRRSRHDRHRGGLACVRRCQDAVRPARSDAGRSGDAFRAGRVALRPGPDRRPGRRRLRRRRLRGPRHPRHDRSTSKSCRTERRSSGEASTAGTSIRARRSTLSSGSSSTSSRS